MQQARVKNPELHIKIKTALLRSGYTQSRFAHTYGIDNGLMSNICSGKRYPSFEVFNTIADNTGNRLKMEDWDLDFRM